LNTPTGREKKQPVNVMLLKSISDPVSEREEAAGGSLSDLLNAFLAAELTKTRKDDPVLLLVQAEMLVGAAMRMLRRERAQTIGGFSSVVGQPQTPTPTETHNPSPEVPRQKKKRAKKT
jgi:hypothetical protein